MKDLNASSSSTWAETLPSQWEPGAAPAPGPAEIEIPWADAAPHAAPHAVPSPTRLSLGRWLREGLRAAVFLSPRTGAATPTPWQLLALSLGVAALLVGAARLQVAGAAQFDLRGWLAPMWSSLVLLWLAWWAMAPAQRAPAPPAPHERVGVTEPAGGLAAWYVLTALAPLAPTLLLYTLTGTAAHRPSLWAGDVAATVFWVAYGVLTVWVLAALVGVSARFIRSRKRTGMFAVAVVAVVAVGTWQFPDQPWLADGLELAEVAEVAEVADSAAPASEAQAQGGVQGQDEEPATLQLSQAVFERQQALWQQQVGALLPERPGVVDVYGLVFAPFADENVFQRESTMVSTLLQERFDARGRVMHLLNHPDTAQTHVWATPENLQRAVAALGARMDRERDVLVVYATSHGARNHALAASHGPLEVAPVTPQMLRAALDGAGIRNRVIAVSACFSGGWIEPLATDSTLVMTAADATHTSYGCGRLSELTFFGRAVFNEQLRQTYSFTQAFANAVPLIAERETEAGKTDGFSNPQLRVGGQIAPVLRALEQRLEAAAQAETDVRASAPLAVVATAASIAATAILPRAKAP